MGERDERPVVETVSGGGIDADRAAAVVLLALVLVTVGLLKPWGEPAAGGASERVTASATLAIATLPPPAAGAQLVATDPAAIPCSAPDGWRLVSLQQTSDRVTRTWLVVKPVSATRPEDPTIHLARLVGTDFAGIGFCADGRLAPGGPARIVAAWQHNDALGWQPLAIARLPRAPDDVGAPGAADAPDSLTDALLYRPIASPVPDALVGPTLAPSVTDPAWSLGAYAFAVDAASAGGVVHAWFHLDLVWPPGGEGSGPPEALLAEPSRWPGEASN